MNVSLRTFFLVTIVTLLIWGFAESESVSETRVVARIEFRDSPERALLVTGDGRGSLAADWSGEVSLSLSGSAGRLGIIREQLRNPLVLEVGQGEIPGEPGVHTLDLREVLRGVEPLGSGASLLSVDPPELGVEIRQLQEVEAAVTVLPPAGMLVTPAEVDPPIVRLRGPAEDIALLGDQPQVTVRLTTQDFASLEPGVRQTLPPKAVRLPDILAESVFARSIPRAVSVSVTPARATESFTAAVVPLYVKRPAFEADRYVVRVPETDRQIRDVKITGPSDVIRDIREGRTLVSAMVILTPDDLTRAADAGSTRMRVQFADLPTSMTFEWDQREVTIEVQRIGGP